MAFQPNIPAGEQPPPSAVATNNYEGNHRHPAYPSVSRRYYTHSNASRVSTETVVAQALKAQYPSLSLTITPFRTTPLLSFAASGHAESIPLSDKDVNPSSLSEKSYIPPARRLDGDIGSLGENLSFGKFLFKWQGKEFIVYLVDGRDGSGSYPQVMNLYVLSADAQSAEELILVVGRWADDLHEEVWVFDQGNWTKSKELYDSIRSATWSNVILDEEMKKTLINDHLSFFRARETYASLRVPWKRGVIYYGPPGNGKTISVKATMNMLYNQNPSIPTLYVRTLTSWMGPEASVKMIFAKARQFAPCYLVLEDLDTIVTDAIRSYFLNEVDGLGRNDGIFMVGSTNHLDRLDPGISKRPSRFDRKYFFPDPDHSQRIAYAQFWQKKLADNEEVDFPDRMCKAVADITDGFSFAYMQEAFVAALLAIARRSDEEGEDEEGIVEGDWIAIGADDHDGDGLEKNPLWVEIKKQIAILREGMEEKS